MCGAAVTPWGHIPGGIQVPGSQACSSDSATPEGFATSAQELENKWAKSCASSVSPAPGSVKWQVRGRVWDAGAWPEPPAGIGAAGEGGTGLMPSGDARPGGPRARPVPGAPGAEVAAGGRSSSAGGRQDSGWGFAGRGSGVWPARGSCGAERLRGEAAVSPCPWRSEQRARRSRG